MGENKAFVLSSHHTHKEYVEGCIRQYETGDSLAGFPILPVSDVHPGIYQANLREKAVLSPEAKELFDSLAQSGLNPYIKYAHDGCGMYEWYEMWIRW